MSDPKRILFVCLGNIVRSPLAENLFRHMAQQRGVAASYEVDSAGTSNFHIGERPDPRMRRVAAAHGVENEGRARRVTSEDLDEFDLIIAMDSSNRNALKRLASSPEQEAKIHLMREFDSQGSPEDPVPDPWYGGQQGFEDTYLIVERATEGLLDALEAGEIS